MYQFSDVLERSRMLLNVNRLSDGRSHQGFSHPFFWYWERIIIDQKSNSKDRELNQGI